MGPKPKNYIDQYFNTDHHNLSFKDISLILHTKTSKYEYIGSQTFSKLNELEHRVLTEQYLS